MVSLSSGGMVNSLLIAVTILTTVQVQGSRVKNRLFQWTRHPENYVSEGKTLIGHYVIDYSHKYVSSQCALECLRHHRCKSFNFDRELGRCELNNATHRTHPRDFVDSKDSEYHVRESFSIDPEALGPCATNPCNDRGRCIETKNSAGDLMPVCLCNEGWTGTRCQLAAHTVDWDEWEDWSECSVTCHRGWQTRKRKCKDYETGRTVSSLECHGADVEYSVCIRDECPKWEEWGDWELCSASKTCGRGIKLRHRRCNNGGVPGVDRYCLGSSNESTPCQGIDCIGAMRLQGGVAHGEGRLELYNDLTGQWGHMCADQLTPAVADLACMQIGLPGAHAVVRDGRYGGSGSDAHIALTDVLCQGREKTLMQCPHNDWTSDGACKTGYNVAAGLQCNVNGVWSLWSSWTDCSVTCESGSRQRTRMCNHPPQMHGGKPCEGEDIQYKPCRLDMCPSDGTWAKWSDWSSCSALCGPGTHTRVRKCATAYPCEGHSKETEDCQAAFCAVNGTWIAWGQWSPCSTSCSHGTQDRTRSCYGPFYGGVDCVGEKSQRQGCKLRECPVDGVWEVWGSWGNCSLPCGGGTHKRSRTCKGPFYDGLDCVGSPTDTEPCNTHNCPVDGEWASWGDWGKCSVTCGGGTQSRQRKCHAPKHGGENCPGNADQTQPCGNISCAIDGVWLGWSEWSLCSVTCALGTRTRERSCKGPFYGGRDCIGDAVQNEDCFEKECPVDGHWMDWITWSDCSASCGKGSRTRTRECDKAQYGGKSCDGEDSQTEECGGNICPVDGVWEEFGSWSVCSKTCGTGTRFRTRGCTGPFYGGKNCTGDSIQHESCNTQPCPDSMPILYASDSRVSGVDGVIGDWSDWTECTLTCGGGQRSRERTCLGPFYGGVTCPEHLNETELCNKQPCPVDGVFKDWEEWSSCSLTCGGGTRERYRGCEGPYHGGANCSGAWMESEPCNVHYCPVDGVWEDWEEWSNCTELCGGGSQWRSRNCTGPFHGGADCAGPANQTRPCNEQPCPVDGKWLPWTTWEICSATCGTGKQRRERTCVGVLHGGRNCTGDSWQIRACNTHKCPVDGVLGDWSEWSECSLTCSGGSQWRNRSCIGPFFGGNDCTGMRNGTQTCNSNPCPVDGYYEDWLPWGDCSTTCGGGMQDRTRTCVPPKYGGQDCQGPANETQPCNPHPCPVDGYYHDWSDWGTCSLTCGGGSQWRNRVCEPPQYDGKDCDGPANDTQKCNTHHCPIDGFWYEWSQWADCTTTCGKGTRERLRVCEQPKYGGAPCSGESADYLPCAENPCPIPGDWLAWMPWSACSVTCNGGVRRRSRECNMTSYGDLTDPCEGVSKEAEDCHTFTCFPYARTCSEWKDRGLTATTDLADVDPDGEDGPLDSRLVKCDFDSQPEEGVTVIGHDSEAITRVQGWEGAQEFEQVVTYNIPMKHVLSIIDQSASCKQYVRWDCKAAIMHNEQQTNTGWKNRTGQLADYFGSAAPGSSSCECGMNNTCAKTNDPMRDPLLCNCDMNDDNWRFDDGFITVKNDLPVTSFVAGDTGNTYEDGYVTVGAVQCVGAAH